MHHNFNDTFDFKAVSELEQELNSHPVYSAVQTREDLNAFMRHHIFSVWDFMSLLKFLQFHIAPAVYPWFPATRHVNARRFVNAIVLEEESDENGSSYGYISHFEMYLSAMRELDIKTSEIDRFSESVRSIGIERALQQDHIPAAAANFIRKTFDFIETGKPHIGAAAFAFGREKIIPDMFRNFISRSGMKAAQAPSFFYYLERHIHLDEGCHAPLAMKMLEELCEGNEEKIHESSEAACEAIRARIAFWDGVLEKLPSASKRPALLS